MSASRRGAARLFLISVLIPALSFGACRSEGSDAETAGGETSDASATSVASTTRVASARPERDGVTIEYIAHAAFRVTYGEVTLMVDPYESRWWLGYDFPTRLPDPTAVLLSHPHPDHDAGYEAGRAVPWGEQVAALTSPGHYVFDDVNVYGIRGKHADPYGEEFGQRNTIWLIDTGDLRIAHIGDNGPVTDEIVEALGQVDILMLPVDDLEHILSHEEVAEWRARIGPRVVVPMHYRHDDLEVDPESPSDLASVDDWLASQIGVERLAAHVTTVRHDVLPELPQVWVFPHYPALAPPN